MSEPLVTQAQLEGVLRRLRALEARVGRTEVRESPEYETDSFTPTLVGLGATPGTFTYTAQGGEYTVIGNRCFFNGRLAISAITVAPTAASGVVIQGLPFAGVAGAHLIAGGATMILWQTNLSTAHTQIAGQLNNGSAAIALIKSGDNLGGAAVIGSDIAIVGLLVEFRFEGQYRVA